jgi:hypothetical protein
VVSGHIKALDPSDVTTVLRCDATGKLLVAVSGAGSGGTSSDFAAAFPTAGTAAGFKNSAGTAMSPGNLDASGNLKVAGSLSVTPTAAATSALSNVVENLASTTLLAANAARYAFRIENDSDGVLLIKCGTTASPTSFTARILPRGTFTTADLGINYTGRIDGIWETTPGTAGHAAARVTELSA